MIWLIGYTQAIKPQAETNFLAQSQKQFAYSAAWADKKQVPVLLFVLYCWKKIGGTQQSNKHKKSSVSLCYSAIVAYKNMPMCFSLKAFIRASQNGLLWAVSYRFFWNNHMNNWNKKVVKWLILTNKVTDSGHVIKVDRWNHMTDHGFEP